MRFFLIFSRLDTEGDEVPKKKKKNQAEMIHENITKQIQEKASQAFEHQEKRKADEKKRSTARDRAKVWENDLYDMDDFTGNIFTAAVNKLAFEAKLGIMERMYSIVNMSVVPAPSIQQVPNQEEENEGFYTIE